MKKSIKIAIAGLLASYALFINANATCQIREKPLHKSIYFEDIGNIKITGYDTCVQCCGKSDGITASGTKAEVGRTCAYNALPFGTKLYIVGIGYRYVEDRGGMKGIDILCNNHEECYAITGTYKVYVVKEINHDET